MSKKHILVTGADGFIGSHLVERLVKSGHNVRAFVYYNSFGNFGWLDRISLDIQRSVNIFSGDIRDPNGVRKAIEGCDTIIHLAALIGIPFSYHSPDTYIDTNIKGTLNILQAARDEEINHIIHTSTSEVYGTAKFVPISEDHPLNGQSPYSATKIAADQLALSFFYSFQTPVTILRPFNTYGPRQSTRAVIPAIITQFLGGEKNISLGSLSPTRDFNFVEDIVRAFQITAEKSPDISIGKIINLGSNFEISIGETAKIIADMLDVKVGIKLDKQRIRPEKSEVQRLFADNALAEEVLGWVPNHRGLEGFRRGLSKTISWYKESQNLSHFKIDHYQV